MPQQNVEPVDFGDETAKTGEKNRIKTTISRLYNNMVNVTVVTGVGDLGIRISTTDEDEKFHLDIADQQQTLQAFVTQFDLLEGDIVTTVPDDYAQHPAIQQLHERNVATATRVLPDNITALVNAGREVIRLFNA